MNVRLLFAFIAFSATLNSCNAQKSKTTFLNTGLIRSHFILCNYNPGEDVGDNTFRVWYLDSAVIIEIVAIEFDWNIPIAKRPPAKLNTRKFVYMDVKTGLCQDYQRLDPKEIPITNYKVTSSDYFFWSFYRTDSVSPLYDKPAYNLTDTIIDNEKYKRIVLENVEGSYNMKKIFYQSTKYSSLFLQLSPFMDSKYPEKKVLRTDLLVNNKLYVYQYLVQQKNSLSDTEIEIFNSWAKNAKNCKLPILTLHEAANKFLEYYSAKQGN